jgi:hypothetical protein
MSSRRACVRLVVAIAVLSLAGAVLAAVPVAPPATPAGQQLVWVLGALNSSEPPSPAVIEQHFSPAFLKLAPPAKLVQALGPIGEQRPLRITAVLSRQGALGLQVRIESRTGARFRVTIQVGAGPAHLIEGLLFEPLGVKPTYSLYVPMRDGVRPAVDGGRRFESA